MKVTHSRKDAEVPKVLLVEMLKTLRTPTFGYWDIKLPLLPKCTVLVGWARYRSSGASVALSDFSLN